MSKANDFLGKHRGEEPAHQWEGSLLRFQSPSGGWLLQTEQKGNKGDKGPTGETGPKGNTGPAG